MKASQFGLQRRSRDGLPILALKGDLDEIAAPLVTEALLSLLEQGHRQVVLDLSGVRHIDFSGTGCLIGAYRRVRQREGSLQLIAGGREVVRKLSVCGLDRVFGVCSSEEEAVAACVAAVTASSGAGSRSPGETLPSDPV